MLCTGILAIPDRKVIKGQSSTDCQFQGKTELPASHYQPQ